MRLRPFIINFKPMEKLLFFGFLAEDKFPQLGFIQKDFIASIDYLGSSLRFDSFGFDPRHQQDISSPQLTKVNFDSRSVVPVARN